MLVLFFGAGISFILLVGRPIPLSWIKEFVRVFYFQLSTVTKSIKMKNKTFYSLFFSAIAILCSSCASTRPVTDNIIRQVGGTEQLANFQYYISRDIVLKKMDQETDGRVQKGGAAEITYTTKKDEIDIRKSTPGVVIGYAYSPSLKTNILRVAFGDDDNCFLQFAHINKTHPDTPYYLIKDDEYQGIIYGDAVYDYSSPESFALLRKIGINKQKNPYGDTPILLIKLKRSHNLISTKRTEKGRRVGR